MRTPELEILTLALGALALSGCTPGAEGDHDTPSADGGVASDGSPGGARREFEVTVSSEEPSVAILIQQDGQGGRVARVIPAAGPTSTVRAVAPPR